MIQIECAFVGIKKEPKMLGTLIVWRTLVGDKRGLTIVGAVILAITVGTLVWNLIP